ncbi:Uncharacterized protein APZ42_031800 [Daphnia magna]|uniref:Secreted protein n=1 Tax=Daphnia magna TaxID=35525 RepID=A0A0P5TCZ7_9CRUS|nr:Uncharacterized protein APZ42_031800 [Daphnia magna]
MSVHECPSVVLLVSSASLLCLPEALEDDRYTIQAEQILTFAVQLDCAHTHFCSFHACRRTDQLDYGLLLLLPVSIDI